MGERLMCASRCRLKRKIYHNKKNTRLENSATQKEHAKNSKLCVKKECKKNNQKNRVSYNKRLQNS